MDNTPRSGGNGMGGAKALKRIEFLVLAVLRTGPLHGYGIVQELSRRTVGEVQLRPGSLYRVLDRLMHRGFLEAAGASPADERRQDYRITSAGEAAARGEAEILAGLVAPLLESGPTEIQ